MSLIGDRLQTWLKYHSTSTLRQNMSTCEMIPPATKDQMIDISESSARYEGEYKPEKIKEKGAPITEDYTLGDIRTGTRDHVTIPRPPGTIGTFHTHPFGSSFPSLEDTLDIMGKDDKITCIGATGKPGTKIQCFTPNKPRWDEILFKFRLLDDDIKDYNKKVGAKFKGTRDEVRLKVAQTEPMWYTEGQRLHARKVTLKSQIKAEIHRLATPKEWKAFKHGEYIPYFEAYPNIFNKCRITWEGFDEDLPYEL